MQPRLVRLARIVSAALHVVAVALILCAIVITPIYFQRAHFVWIWFPFSDYRIRIMVRQYSTEIRTAFSETHDHDIILGDMLLWLCFLVILLNVILHAAAGLSLELWKAIGSRNGDNR